MSAYLLLFFAVIAEIIGTSALKASYGFTKLWPSLCVATAYSISFWLMSITLKTLPVSIVYAIWSGLGIFGISLIGIFFFKEAFGIWHLVGTACIITGVVILSLLTSSH